MKFLDNFFNKENIIEFVGPDEFKHALSEPKPAVNFMPKWYKNLSAYMDGDENKVGFKILNDGTFEGHTSMTAKKCVPLQDAFSTGYIIPLWADLLITVDNPYDKGLEEPSYVQFNWSNNWEAISSHSADQLGKDFPWPRPIDEMPGGRAWKMNNPWVIKTKPGYSCIFTTPFNRPELKIQPLTGIVDTDQYQSRINFPFVFDAPSGEHVVEAGTPLVQVIPFKRQDWKSIVRYETSIDEEQRSAIENKLKMHFKEGYKKFWWSKKRFR